MSILRGEAIIVHGCKLKPDGQLSDRGAGRVDVALDKWYEDVAPNIVFSGSHTFTLRKPPVRTEAAAMLERAVAKSGEEPNRFSIEDKSLDTVGNVLFAKTKFAMPNDWANLVVVTSELHMPRTLEIYRHVLGPDFRVQPAVSPEEESTGRLGIAFRKTWERVGDSVVDYVLKGTAVGDHEAIQERLFNAIPGYDSDTRASKPRLAAQIAIEKAQTGLANMVETMFPPSPPAE